MLVALAREQGDVINSLQVRLERAEMLINGERRAV